MAKKSGAVPNVMKYGNNEVVISDDNWMQFVNPVVDGETKVCGTFPRYVPKGAMRCAAKPFDLPLIPENEWQDRLDEQLRQKAQLSDLRDISGPGGKPIPSTDQNGRGYCWCHSGTSATLIVRALMGQPFVSLSAYMVGCLIKNYRDEGGWGTEGLEFIAENGIPDEKYWPQRSASRSNDNPAMRANAKLHRVQEWMDVPGRSLPHLVTLLLSNIPVVSDFNWWGHSVCTIDLLAIKPKLKTRIWNSWGDSWSANGVGVLEGSKAMPDDMIAPRVVLASKD